MDNFTIFYFLPHSSTRYDMTQFKVCFIIRHKCGLGKKLSSVIMKVSVYSTRTAAAVTPTPPPPVRMWDRGTTFRLFQDINISLSFRSQTQADAETNQRKFVAFRALRCNKNSTWSLKSVRVESCDWSRLRVWWVPAGPPFQAAAAASPSGLPPLSGRAHRAR